MKEWLKTTVKAIICQRAVNAGFVLVCVAGALGCPDAVTLLVSAGLYALLVWLG